MFSCEVHKAVPSFHTYFHSVMPNEAKGQLQIIPTYMSITLGIFQRHICTICVTVHQMDLFYLRATECCRNYTKNLVNIRLVY